MSITTDRQLLAHINANLHHRRLVVHNVLHSLDDLEDILAVNVLAILKPLNHIIDKLLGHLTPKAHTIIVILHLDSIDVQALKCGRRVGDLNGLLKFYTADELLALGQLDLRILVVWLALNDGLEIPKGSFIVEDGGFGKGASPVCLGTAKCQCRSYKESEPSSACMNSARSISQIQVFILFLITTDLNVVWVQFQSGSGIGDGETKRLEFDLGLKRK